MALMDTDLIHQVANAISDAARAKHHEFARREQPGFTGSAKAETTETVSGRFKVTGKDFGIK